MFNKKIIFATLVIVSFIISFSTISTAIQPQQNNSLAITNKESFITKNSLRSLINITNNAELATIATSGEGSKASPYIISNMQINTCTKDEIGINIQNTTKNFVLTNISILGCSIGFLFSNVSYGSITDSYVSNYTGSAFELNFSSNNILKDNTAIYGLNTNALLGGPGGFFLNNSIDNMLINNSVINPICPSWSVGFTLGSHSNYNHLINNKVYCVDFAGYLINTNSDYNYLENNTVNIDNTFGFELWSFASNNILINNTAINGNTGFEVGSNNTELQNNKAINNTIGFDLLDASNSILINNIGISNANDFLEEYYCSNTTLRSNKFIFMNNGLAYSNSQGLFNYTNIITIIFLLGIFSWIGYKYNASNKKKLKMQNLIGKKTENNTSQEESTDFIVLISILGLADIILVIYILVIPFLTVGHIFSFNRFYAISVNMIQFSSLSAILILGGLIVSLLSVILYVIIKSPNRVQIGKSLSLMGFITQIIGFMLSLLVYYGFINSINNVISSVKGNIIQPYNINFAPIPILVILVNIVVSFVIYLSLKN